MSPETIGIVINMVAAATKAQAAMACGVESWVSALTTSMAITLGMDG